MKICRTLALISEPIDSERALGRGDVETKVACPVQPQASARLGRARAYPGGNSVIESVFPSGSLNHATSAPLGDAHTPIASWFIPS